jgi:hypothetical protein
MDEVFLSWSDLGGQHISNLDIKYFTDGSSFVQDGTGFAGYVVVTLDSLRPAFHQFGLLHKRLKLLPQ